MNHFKKEIKKKTFSLLGNAQKHFPLCYPAGDWVKMCMYLWCFAARTKKEKKRKKKIEEISSVRLWENQMASIRTDVAPLSFFLSCSLRDFVRATSFSIDGGVSTARPPL